MRKAASLPPRETPKTPKGASLKPSPLKAARRIANNQGGESLHRPGFTIEIGRGKNPLPITELEPIYARLIEMLLAAMIL